MESAHNLIRLSQLLGELLIYDTYQLRSSGPVYFDKYSKVMTGGTSSFDLITIKEDGSIRNNDIKPSNKNHQLNLINGNYCIICEFAARMEKAITRKKKVCEKKMQGDVNKCLQLPNNSEVIHLLYSTVFMEEKEKVKYEQVTNKTKIFSSSAVLQIEANHKDKFNDIYYYQDYNINDLVDGGKENQGNLKDENECQLCEIGRKVSEIVVSTDIKSEPCLDFASRTSDFWESEDFSDFIHLSLCDRDTLQKEINLQNHAIEIQRDGRTMGISEYLVGPTKHNFFFDLPFHELTPSDAYASQEMKKVTKTCVSSENKDREIGIENASSHKLFTGNIAQQLNYGITGDRSETINNEVSLHANPNQNGLFERVLKLQDDVAHLTRALKIDPAISTFQVNNKIWSEMQNYYVLPFLASEVWLDTVSLEKRLTRQYLIREYMAQLLYLEWECKSELNYLSRKKENIDHLAGMAMSWGPMII